MEEVKITRDRSGKLRYHWPWSSWSSGVEYKFVGTMWGKTPQQMINLWRTIGPRRGFTVHSYIGTTEEGVTYALLSMEPYDESHDRLDCDLCGDERKITTRRGRRQRE